MSLLKLTSTYSDGRTRPVIINTDIIKDITPDDRPGSPSKAVVILKDGFRHFVVETVEEIGAQL